MKKEFDTCNVKLVFVGIEEEKSDSIPTVFSYNSEFVKDTGLEGQLYADSTREVFNAFGCLKSGSVIKSLTALKNVRWQYLKKVNLKGDLE